jgi:isopentenyl-diphosphate delta-isomerase
MIDKRKIDHIRISVEENVEAGSSGFENIRLIHEALPEIDFDKIDTEIEFLGKKLRYPLILEAMTGGVPSAKKINGDLASIAEKFGIGFGVGSQRMAIDNPELAETYQVRDIAPGILLIANLGAVQLNYGYGLEECEKAIDMIDADALALHLNPLHELIQPEGNRDFSNLVEKINSISGKLKKPLIAKCVGSGISYETARNLRVSAIDVGGSGGTSWSLIESHRGDASTESLGKTFAGWGIPTAESIKEVSKLKIPLIGSGGIRTGIDAAKAIALGADCVGMALPVLREWSSNGKKGVEDFLDQFFTELKIAMFLTGSKNVRGLKGKFR